MKKIIFLFCLIAIARHSSAQAIFISKGKIEFEKRTNMWISMTGSFAEQLKKTLPEYKTSYFNYEFDAKKAIYKPGREA